MYEKNTKFHLGAVVIVLLIITIALINIQTRAQWISPSAPPGGEQLETTNLLFNPLQGDLELNNFKIYPGQSLTNDPIIDTASDAEYVIYAKASNENDDSIGVYAQGNKYGISAKSSNYSGYFEGNVEIVGDLNIQGNLSSTGDSDFFVNLETLNVYGSEINREEQVIYLDAGWNNVSFNIDPSSGNREMNIEEMLLQIFYDSGLIDDLSDTYGLSEYISIVKARNWVYIPDSEYSINDWECDKGYKFGMWKPAKITIQGTKIDTGKIISLPSGWSWIPYLPQISLPIEVALVDIINDITIVKTNKNGEEYGWSPGCSIGSENCNLFNMEPGLMYSIAVDNNVELQYTIDTYSLSVGDGISTFSNDVDISNSLNVGVGGINSEGDIYSDNIFVNGIYSNGDIQVLSYNLDEYENTIYGVSHDSSSGHLLKLQSAEYAYSDDYIPIYNYYDKFTVDIYGNTTMQGDLELHGKTTGLQLDVIGVDGNLVVCNEENLGSIIVKEYINNPTFNTTGMKLQICMKKFSVNYGIPPTICSSETVYSWEIITEYMGSSNYENCNPEGVLPNE